MKSEFYMKFTLDQYIRNNENKQSHNLMGLLIFIGLLLLIVHLVQAIPFH